MTCAMKLDYSEVRNVNLTHVAPRGKSLELGLDAVDDRNIFSASIVTLCIFHNMLLYRFPNR